MRRCDPFYALDFDTGSNLADMGRSLDQDLEYFLAAAAAGKHAASLLGACFR